MEFEITWNLILGETVPELVVRAIFIGIGFVISLLFHKKRFAELERKIESKASGTSVTVNLEGQSHGVPLIDAAVSCDVSHQELMKMVKAHTQGNNFPHDQIWETHIALGQHGIPWPGPGITPEFRCAISREIYAALETNDMERARFAWSRQRPVQPNGLPPSRKNDDD